MGEKCKVSSFSDVGIQNRRSVETLYVTSLPNKPNGTLILMADGFGNDINSNLISKLVCESFISLYSENEIKTPTKEAVSDIFQSLQAFVVHKSSFFNSSGLKVAFMAVFIWDNHLMIGHVGNISSVYLKKGTDIELSWLTKSTKNQPFDSIPGLGKKGNAEPEIIDNTTASGEKLFIMTDGITEIMPEGEILSFIRKHPNASFPKTIVNHVNDLGAEDNSTAIIVEFGASSSVGISNETKKAHTPPPKKEKPVRPPKEKPLHAQKRSYTWFWWLLIIGIIGAALWWGIPRFQEWRTRITPSKPSIPITQLPPVEEPVEIPVPKEVTVVFQVQPINAWIQVVSGKVDQLSETDIRLYETHGESNQVVLKAGEYTAYAQYDGYLPRISHFTLTEDQPNHTVMITLEKKPAPPPTPAPVTPPPPKTPVKPPVVTPKPPIQPTPPPVVKEWSIVVTSQPTGAKIYINNQFLGMFTTATLKFKPGTYLVTVSKAGYKDQSRTVTFTATPPAFKTISFSLEKQTAFVPGHLFCLFPLSGEAI